MRCTLAAWAASAILALGCTAALAQDANPTEPMPEPPGTQPPDPPVFPEPLPEPEIVTPPEAPPILFPVTVEWAIPEPDPAVSNNLRFVSVFCGTESDPYKFGAWQFAQPGTHGVINLPAPAQCMAVAYYWQDNAYRYSEPSPAVLVDPLKPAAPELLPAGMETSTMQCATATQRCTTSRLQTSTRTRDGVRTRTCSCLLVD